MRPLIPVVLLAALSARAATLTPAETDYFETKVRPILVNNCYKCHSHEIEKLKGGLSVEFRDTILKGGDNGPALVPGHPETSLLIKAVQYNDDDLQMPPRGKKLSDEQIENLVTWVKMGAPDPRDMTTASGKTLTQDKRDHWAFKSIKNYPVPEVQDTNWPATPVDSFILAKLEENGMKPAPPADRRTLIRRATFDLTGLPPTPQEVDAFVNDTSPDAYAKVVDRLLASPQYGERWGRFWLDVARYSDTKGDVKAQQDTPFYPYAWTYRDYVIKAFNEDKPYNRFILEQIAGDKLPMGTDRSQLAALGFLALGPRFNDNINDIINDRIDVVCKGTLGLTVTCARCHDHKFDPIPQKDYYSLRGVFISCVEPAEEPILSAIKMTPDYMAFSAKLNDLNQQLAAADAKFKSLRRASAGTPEFKQARRDVIRLRGQADQLQMTDPASPPRATVLFDSTKPHDSPLFIRGEAENQGDIVPRRFLEVLSPPNRPVFRSGSGRLELAEDIVDSRNPLTARVLVNRVWMHHFGEGFVTTPDDFGNQSDPPSHPELLDYLALHFMQDGWSIKKLHRLIMLSNVYQESSETNPRYAQADPQNRLLWRSNIRRLEFEAVRDSILSIGGQLDLTMGGEPVRLGEGGYSHRRTVYGYVDRRNLPEVYSQFDFANPDIVSGKRYETTVPQQALFMMNSPLVIELARKLVNQPDFQDMGNGEDRVKYLYERILQREPTDVEIKLGLEFIDESPAPEIITAETRQRIRQDRIKKVGNKQPQAMSLANIPPGQMRAVDAWDKYAHALLQTNEALFLN